MVYAIYSKIEKLLFFRIEWCEASVPYSKRLISLLDQVQYNHYQYLTHYYNLSHTFQRRPLPFLYSFFLFRSSGCCLKQFLLRCFCLHILQMASGSLSYLLRPLSSCFSSLDAIATCAKLTASHPLATCLNVDIITSNDTN